jgi:ubiquinone/menaquinone biosynthesis C-methylase UbiE
METSERKKHWENIYETKSLAEVSWYQPVPVTSLEFIAEAGLSKSAKIIDVGGGDSFLADNLLKEGYNDITVLDISEAALERAKKRLGENAAKIKWIIADAAHFSPVEKYDLWHDRAAFHFLTEKNEIENYCKTASASLHPGGTLVIGAFSDKGPLKCSGIEIKQYTGALLEEAFCNEFRQIKCMTTDHPTPSGKFQNFIFCSFIKQ